MQPFWSFRLSYYKSNYNFNKREQPTQQPKKRERVEGRMQLVGWELLFVEDYIYVVSPSPTDFWMPASLKFRKFCHLPANISLRNWKEAHPGQLNCPWRTRENLQDSAKNLATEVFLATASGKKNFISYHCVAYVVFKNTNLIMISCRTLDLHGTLVEEGFSRLLNTSFLMCRLIPGKICVVVFFLWG